LPGQVLDVDEVIAVRNLSIAISWHRLLKRYPAGQMTAASVGEGRTEGLQRLALVKKTDGHDSDPRAMRSSPEYCR
jgi:hypothetical protein